MKVKAPLKELRDAEVRFISLVDRSASRIAFRVLKRDNEETEMGLDLTRIKKAEKKAATPEVAEVVVFLQTDAALAEQVRKSIADVGFTTETVQKSEKGDALVFAQDTKSKDGLTVVRLSEQLAVGVRAMPAATGFMAEAVKAAGFYPDLATAADLCGTHLVEAVAKADAAAIKSTLTDFNVYVQMVADALPTSVFKADAAIAAVLPVKKEETPAKEEEKPAAAVVKEEEKKETPVVEAAKETPVVEVKAPETAVVEKKDEPVVKADDPMKSVLDAIAAMKTDVGTQISGLSTKVEDVASKQTAQATVLDGLAKKQESVEKTLGGIVTAVPQKEDVPAHSSAVRKQEDTDGRTGVFDTASIPRTKRTWVR